MTTASVPISRYHPAPSHPQCAGQVCRAGPAAGTRPVLGLSVAGATAVLTAPARPGPARRWTASAALGERRSRSGPRIDPSPVGCPEGRGGESVPRDAVRAEPGTERRPRLCSVCVAASSDRRRVTAGGRPPTAQPRPADPRQVTALPGPGRAGRRHRTGVRAADPVPALPGPGEKRTGLCHLRI